MTDFKQILPSVHFPESMEKISVEARECELFLPPETKIEFPALAQPKKPLPYNISGPRSICPVTILTSHVFAEGSELSHFAL